jgi:putative transcriptional regulator
MGDNSFARTVVLITEHSDDGSVGFILNKPLGFSLKDIIPEIDCDLELYNGGPVEQDNLYFIHEMPELIPDSVEISNGIFWGGNFNVVKSLLNERKLDLDKIKFFLGYSGWSSDQLLNELKENSWQLAKIKSNKAINRSNNIWRNKMQELGGVFKIWANAPSDPSLN